MIGHEIGHVVSRHHDERITTQMGTPTLLGIGSAILGSRYGSGAPTPPASRRRRGADGFPAAELAHPGIRSRRGRPGTVAQAGFDPRQAVKSVAEHDSGRRQQRSPAAMAVDAPRSGLAHRRTPAPAPRTLMPVYEQARAAGRTPMRVNRQTMRHWLLATQPRLSDSVTAPWAIPPNDLADRDSR